ncbi:MAG: hypothetical protein AB7R89_29855 [Dehalococcoidia bacterium]
MTAKFKIVRDVWEPEPGGSPKPTLLEAIQTRHGAARPDGEPTPDELDRWNRWRHATLEERGRALSDLLDLIDAIGHFPPKREMFPGFPQPRGHRVERSV